MTAAAEDAIREAHQRGDYETTVAEALARYEVEIYSFLCARLGGEADAHEVYGQVREDLWKGIEGFQWRSSLRTWLYTLARNAAVRYERSPANRGSRRKPLSQVSEPVALERSRTRPYLRTDVKDRFAAVRSRLSPDEQTLLVLRVDRDLSWDDVAQIYYGEEAGDEATARRRAANLRQRFRTLKRRLKEMLEAEGVFDEP